MLLAPFITILPYLEFYRYLMTYTIWHAKLKTLAIKVHELQFLEPPKGRKLRVEYEGKKNLPKNITSQFCGAFRN